MKGTKRSLDLSQGLDSATRPPLFVLGAHLFPFWLPLALPRLASSRKCSWVRTSWWLLWCAFSPCASLSYFLFSHFLRRIFFFLTSYFCISPFTFSSRFGPRPERATLEIFVLSINTAASRISHVYSSCQASCHPSSFLLSSCGEAYDRLLILTLDTHQ